MTDYIDDVFGATGILSRVFQGYAPRPGQIAIARAVDHAIVSGRHLLAEGPTATGKSLAYSVPAIYRAVESRLLDGKSKQVVIVTANLTLQEQLVKKDLPLLQEILPWEFTFTSIKGRSNFLCTEKYETFAAEASAGKYARLDIDGRRQLPVLQEWARESIQHFDDSTGEVSELPFEPKHELWRDLSTDADDCKRSRCKSHDQCFPVRAMQEARRSDIIVTNYAMFFVHLAVYLETGVDGVLPPFEVAILDEVHKATDIARDAFGFELTYEKLRRLARKVQDDHRLQAELLERAAFQLFHVLGDVRRDGGRYEASLDLSTMKPEEIECWKRVGVALKEVRELLGRKLNGARADLEVGGWDDDEQRHTNDRLGKVERDAERARKYDHYFSAATEHAKHEDYVFYLDEQSDKKASIVCKFVRPSEVLRRVLFDKKTATRGADGAPPIVGNEVVVIGASATIATEGGSFAFAKEELGLDDCDLVIGKSPLDFSTQALLVVPANLPEPNDPTFRETVAKTLGQVVEIAHGKTLGLFTSRRALEHAYDSLWPVCRRLGITLMKQGEEPKSILIKRFKEDRDSVLLGTESFWAGVDVPGASLSALVIDRMPFPTPDDPIMNALSRRDKYAFFKFGVPRAIISFRQGFGRLIRSTSDHGVVVCLDKRILTKRWGKQLIKALPDVPMSTRMSAIAEWFGVDGFDENAPVASLATVDPNREAKRDAGRPVVHASRRGPGSDKKRLTQEEMRETAEAVAATRQASLSFTTQSRPSPPVTDDDDIPF